MLVIRGFEGTHPLSSGELAERLGIRHHSVVGLIDRLRGLDLVQRQRANASGDAGIPDILRGLVRRETIARTPTYPLHMARINADRS